MLIYHLYLYELPVSSSEGCVKLSLVTELTAFVISSPVAGSFVFSVTTQAPQPPSRHMDLVPLRFAVSRIKSTRGVSKGKQLVSGLTMTDELR